MKEQIIKDFLDQQVEKLQTVIKEAVDVKNKKFNPGYDAFDLYGVESRIKFLKSLREEIK